MATANITWTPCGSASDGVYVYYGKTLIATGTPISGTGWTLYTGVPLTPSSGSTMINGLDDNVQYTFYTYCHCAAAGNGPLSTVGPIIKYICPTLANVTPSFNGVSYTLNVPSSANNAGSWIQTIQVQAYDSSNTNLLQTNTYTQPFNASINDSFSALASSTNYNIRINYSNNSQSMINNCGSTPFTTSAACVAPTVTVNNPTATGFDVNWTPTSGGTFDILVNNSVIASGLTTGPYTVTGQQPATTYQVSVRKNCTTGGNAISGAQSITTNNANVNGVVAVNLASTPVNDFKTLSMSFTFPQATTFPITVYFGQILKENDSQGNYCNWANGWDLFPIPSNGTGAGCSFLNSAMGFVGYGPSKNLPWVINIPQGVTTYSTAVNTIYTTAGPGNVIGSQYPGGFQYGPWAISGPFSFPIVISDLYMRVISPNGYSAAFAIANGQNTSGITLHNV